jgi:hypothetical protein
MKMNEAGISVPTIIVTAYPTDEAETVSTFESLCVYGVLNKPFDTKALFDAINNICDSGEDPK